MERTIYALHNAGRRDLLMLLVEQRLSLEALHEAYEKHGDELEQLVAKAESPEVGGLVTRWFEWLGFDPKETFFEGGAFDVMVVKAVLEWHGSMVGHGFARGIEGEVGRVRQASAGLAAAAVPAVNGSRSSGGTRGSVIRLEITAGDSSQYSEFLVRELRKFVRVAGGGNVQAALGVSR